MKLSDLKAVTWLCGNPAHVLIGKIKVKIWRGMFGVLWTPYCESTSWFPCVQLGHIQTKSGGAVDLCILSECTLGDALINQFHY